MFFKRRIVMLIMIVMTSVFSTGLFAQDTKEHRQLSRKEKKAERKALLAANLDSIKAMVKDRQYVLEASLLKGKYGSQHFVSSNTNFIMVQEDNIVIQTANPSLIGYNGLGGLTVQGSISDYRIYEDKNSVRILMQISSAALGYNTLSLSFGADGNATAYLQGNFGSRITFIGDVVALENSGAYEGISVF